MPEKSEDTAKSLANLEISDLTGISKPLTKLIETVGGAVGIIYEPARIRRKAKADADAATILAKSNIKITAIQQRAEIRLRNSEARRQENIEAIVRESAKDLNQKNEADVSDAPVDEDWVNDFFDICKDVGNPEMRAVWGRILSGEIAHPGQFSRATLLTLRNLNPQHAKSFENACRLVWVVPSIDLRELPLIFDENKGVCLKLGLSLLNLQSLSDVGLISHNLLGLRIENKNKVVCYYCGQAFSFLSEKNRTRDFPLGIVTFTEVGRELFTITQAKIHPEHQQEVIDHLAAEGWVLQPTSS